MSVITAIVPSARRPGRFDVLVDGRPVATLSIDGVERLALASGRAYHEVRDGVEREGAILATCDRALNMLAFRARSSRELRTQLLRKGEPIDTVDAALARLRDAGVIDDAAFARQFARAKAVGAGMSRRRIESELLRKGVPSDVGREAIADVFADEALDERTVVEDAARKKLRSLQSLDEVTQRRRLYAFLARRGYDVDDIRHVVSRVAGAGRDAVE